MIVAQHMVEPHLKADMGGKCFPDGTGSLNV